MSGALSNTATSLPAAALRPYITHYAGFCISGLPPGTFIGLPSRNITLSISFVEPIEVLRMPNKAQRPDAYGALVAGLQDAPAVVRQRLEAHGVHVFLSPLAPVRCWVFRARSWLRASVTSHSRARGGRRGLRLLRSSAPEP